MNWYKIITASSFVDIVNWTSKTGNSLSLIIGTHRYKYEGLDGVGIANTIDKLKKMKNKHEAGVKLHNLIENIKKYIVE